VKSLWVKICGWKIFVRRISGWKSLGEKYINEKYMCEKFGWRFYGWKKYIGKKYVYIFLNIMKIP
jgi:hypothetical protein